MSFLLRYLKSSSDQTKKRFVFITSGVALGIFFSKPIYDIFIVPVHIWYTGAEHPMTQEVEEFKAKKLLEYKKREEEAKLRIQREKERREAEIAAQKSGLTLQKKQ